MKIKTFLAAMAMTVVTAAHAEYTLLVPQEPGKGTSVWASIIGKHLARFVGEPVVVRHFPGARDIPGFNEFHNKLRTDPKIIMVAHGGNGVSYLLDPVDYDYRQYDSIGMMNLDIVNGRNVKTDLDTGTFVVPGSSGYEPDGMAMAMLLCGPRKTTDEYLACFRERIKWVNGVKGNEKRLGFLRGEFNTTRESPSAWIKFHTGAKANPDNVIWFTHGIYDLEKRQQIPDANFPGTQFEEVYKQRWGEYPRGELYDAYRLTRNWRDVLQKSLWVNRGNPNTERLRQALRDMLSDPAVVADIERDTGRYPWIIGEDGNRVIGELYQLITPTALRTAVRWNQEAYGFPSVFKPELLK